MAPDGKTNGTPDPVPTKVETTITNRLMPSFEIWASWQSNITAGRDIRIEIYKYSRGPQPHHPRIKIRQTEQNRMLPLTVSESCSVRQWKEFLAHYPVGMDERFSKLSLFRLEWDYVFALADEVEETLRERGEWDVKGDEEDEERLSDTETIIGSDDGNEDNRV